MIKTVRRTAAALVLFLLTILPAEAQQLPSLADLVEKLQPTVVNISTVKNTEEDSSATAEVAGVVSANPVIEHYFNPTLTPQLSLGSGFIIDAKGYILTNAHVIDGAREIKVTLADNRQYIAEQIGIDPKTDIALIKIHTEDELPAVTIGDSDQLRSGDWVVAIGNPFGLGGSVTAGIVSAKSRDIESGPYDSFIQTDASINQGSSGGPMFNLAGEVIGINTAIFSTTGANMGIGFAVPINLTNFVVRELISKGKVERGWIGVKIQGRENTGDKTIPQGVIVSAVDPKSPADSAGIEAGDIITAVNEEAIDHPRHFTRTIAETAPGSEIKLSLWRGNKRLQASVMTQKMPENPTVRAPGHPSAPGQIADPAEKDETLAENTAAAASETDLLGLVLQPDAETNNENGIAVLAVSAGSDAEAKGIKAGDRISSIDKQAVFDIDDVRRLLKEADRGGRQSVLLLVYSGQIPHYVAIKMKRK